MKEIPLSKTGKNKGKFVALVDDEDYEYLSQFKWSVAIDEAKTNVYATRQVQVDGKRIRIKLHRDILRITDPNVFIDHADQNGLNCQRANLRVATRAQNGANRRSTGNSKYLGVCYHRGHDNYMVSIRINKVKKNLGSFKSEENAAKAYDEAAKKYHGEFARLNFP